MSDNIKKPRVGVVGVDYLGVFHAEKYTNMTDAGVVLDLMIHDIDLILNFVRSAVRAVHASQNPCG